MLRSIVISFLLLAGLSACATPPAKSASQEVQRGHAKEAQDELSSEVHK